MVLYSAYACMWGEFPEGGRSYVAWYRALVGVGAMGAMAPTLFENMSFGTHTFGKNLIDLSKLTGINQ